MTNPFTEEYYLRGPESGLSNYVDYSWKPDLTIPACRAIMRYIGLQPSETILDWGAARGYMVRGYRELGVAAWGYDISKWAIENCDPAVVAYVSNRCPLNAPYWIVAKDVLEHVLFKDLKDTIRFFMEGARKGVLICVPLTAEPEGSYILEVDNQDSTHVIRWPFEHWLAFLQGCIDDSNAPFVVNGSFRLPGLKEYGGLRHNGCGFFTLRRYP